jgi:DNA-binding protein H-NS
MFTRRPDPTPEPKPELITVPPPPEPKKPAPLTTHPPMDEMPLEMLIELKAMMEATITRRTQEELERLKAEIATKAKLLRIDPAELITVKREKKERKAAAAKYRGPNGEEWSGRGKQPLWIQMLLADGRSIEEFAV